MRPLRAILALLVVALLGAPVAARADAPWTWAPAAAPDPPAGVPAAPYPIALGTIGQISFWAPNRGLLITGGTAVVPAGLYAYDGAGWHQLSTVCGGAMGRIAWAGPTEFWTISDQRPGQVLPGQTGSATADLQRRSLCHFKDGKVVGSYALPLNRPDSYQSLTSAACVSPSNCWFGGVLGDPDGPTPGAFHLHWDGSDVTQVYAPQGHEISSMATMQSQLYEGVYLQPSDEFGSESRTAPALLHTIVTADPVNPFRLAFPANSACAGQVICPPLPAYGTDAAGRTIDPTTLLPTLLATDWTPAGVAGGAAPQLWVVAARNRRASPAANLGQAHDLVLRLAGGQWSQIVPDRGVLTTEPTHAATGVAAEPGTDAMWVAIDADQIGGATYVTRLAADGTRREEVLGPQQGVGPRGEAGPIACAARNDCWVATELGWLFHLTDGTPRERDLSPAFSSVITERPPDAGVPVLPPDSVPPDVSGAEIPSTQVTVLDATVPTGDTGEPRKAKALVTKMQRRLVHRTTLVLTFTLRARARVQLIAKRGKRVVAKSKRQTLKAGRRSVRVKLNRKRWPTSLRLSATAVASATATATGSGTVATRVTPLAGPEQRR